VGVGDSTGVVGVTVSTGVEEVGVAVSTGVEEVGVAVSTGVEEVGVAVVEVSHSKVATISPKTALSAASSYSGGGVENTPGLAARRTKSRLTQTLSREVE
jgi:hypothetical protein